MNFATLGKVLLILCFNISLDYIFISESLRDHYSGGGLFRKGLWGDRVSRPDDWETYPEMNQSFDQASDHALIYVDLDI